MYERVVVPTVLYGAETWSLKEEERKKLNVFEMRCLRGMIGVTRLDRVRNVAVRERTGVERVLAGRVDMSVLRWFGHMERMNEDRMVKKVLISEVNGNRARGRPRFRWMCCVNRALNERGMNVDEARECANDRNEWRMIVNA